MQASASYGNEYLVFGAARNAKEYSNDSFRTSLPSFQGCRNQMERTLESSTRFLQTMRYYIIVDHTLTFFSIKL